MNSFKEEEDLPAHLSANAITWGGLSPINPSQPRKDEYTTANQPLSLPKIESTLNPNAPAFTPRRPVQNLTYTFASSSKVTNSPSPVFSINIGKSQPWSVDDEISLHPPGDDEEVGRGLLDKGADAKKGDYRDVELLSSRRSLEAHALITTLVSDPDKELGEIKPITSSTVNQTTSITSPRRNQQKTSSSVPPGTNLNKAVTIGYGMPNHSPGMSPRNQGGLSPINPSQPRKDEYTTANQPLSLPKIESTLNPNAPAFTPRTSVQNLTYTFAFSSKVTNSPSPVFSSNIGKSQPWSVDDEISLHPPGDDEEVGRGLLDKGADAKKGDYRDVELLSSRRSLEAHALITTVVSDPDKELGEIKPITSSTVNQTTSITSPRRNQQKTSSSVPPGTNLNKAVTIGYGMPNHSPGMSPRNQGGLSPINPSQPRKDEYTTANQPLSLPKIESTLNPNAPAFTPRPSVQNLTYTFASSSKVTNSPSPVFSISKSEMPRSPGPVMVKVPQRPTNKKNGHQPLPIVSNQQQSNGPVQLTYSLHGTFSPFNNVFINVTDRDESVECMNLASVAAAKVVGSMVNSPMSENPGIPGYRMPNHSPGMSPRNQGELSPPSHSMNPNTLNPNAPAFTSRQPGQNVPLTMYLQSLYLAQFSNQPGGMSGSPTGIAPQGMLSQQEFASLISQFVASGQAQGPPPPPPSNGAGGFEPVLNGISHEPVTLNSISPLPAMPPPPLIEPVKGEDWKHLRPIGSERAQRRAPGGPELSKQQNPVNSDVITSVSNPPITSSVITHGSPTPPMEDGPPSTLHNNTDFMNGPFEHSLQLWNSWNSQTSL